MFKDLKRAGVREFLASRLQEPIRDLRSFEELVKKHEAETTLPEIEIKPDDPMLIFTTSGTTAMPKLVPSTHRMYVTNLLNSQLCKHPAPRSVRFR